MKSYSKATKKLLYAVAPAICLVVFSGCAHVFSSRYQKVTIQSSTTGAKIEYPTTGVSKKKGSVKFDKMMMYHTVSFSKEGYKTANYNFQLTKRSPTYAFTALNILVPIYGWFYGIPLDIISPKTQKFDNNQKAPALIAYDKRKDDEKYIIINNTSIDAKGSDITWHQYLGLKSYKNNKHNDTRSVRKLNKSKDREDIKVDNTIFTTALNKTMKKMNFLDTNNTVFPAIGNTLYLDATIKKITINDVETRLGRRTKRGTSNVIPNDLLSIELEIEWDVLDYYKQKIYSTKTTEKSDLFTHNFANRKDEFINFVRESMADNLEYAVMKIRKELSNKGLLTTGNTKTAELAAISITKPVKPENARMNDYMKSAVTIKVDEGHGSGVIVSADGYIVTAYHVVAGTKKIEVVMNDGTKDTATVVRKNEEADLALIKINKTGLLPLQLSNSADPEIGVDVWAIGTPKSVELGQSVSKGILSGLRKANGVSYLQTDVSLNGGNSGGPLVNKDGVVLGIVTSKLVGVGTEGVGFAISAQEIFSRLKLAYN